MTQEDEYSQNYKEVCRVWGSKEVGQELWDPPHFNPEVNWFLKRIIQYGILEGKDPRGVGKVFGAWRSHMRGVDIHIGVLICTFMLKLC